MVSVADFVQRFCWENLFYFSRGFLNSLEKRRNTETGLLYIHAIKASDIFGFVVV